MKKHVELRDILPFDLPLSWAKILEHELAKPYLLDIRAFLEKEKFLGQEVFPKESELFQALELTPFEDVKVVIVGQDPYHGEGQAHGLCFSVQKEVDVPPSLVNIYKELKSDLGIPPANHGNLENWARQGVLLLNATLSVRKGIPMSHQNQGWEKFTDAIIEVLLKNKKHVVFLLWGKHAQEKCERFHEMFSQHLVLKAPHPSPFSARTGFFGCKHFSKTNEYLQEHHKTPINWEVE